MILNNGLSKDNNNWTESNSNMKKW